MLVNADGSTLYLYEFDRQGVSRCKGICAVDWPPLLVSDERGHARFGRGVNSALVGTVRRANGSLQLTYNGWPLYSWRQDSEPGEASGENYDMGAWLAISPNGNGINCRVAEEHCPVPGVRGLRSAESRGPQEHVHGLPTFDDRWELESSVED